MAQKKELQEILKEEIGGIQRVPAMIFFDQEKKRADLGLGLGLGYHLLNLTRTFPPKIIESAH